VLIEYRAGGVRSAQQRPRAGARGRSYNVVDLVNQLESEARNGAAKAGSLTT
jgi:hypothetical protein